MQSANILRELREIDRKVDCLMATVEELTTLVTQVQTDLTTVATSISAEFTKLEEEVAAGTGITPASLEPLKAQVEALDTGIKAIVVPTN